MKEVQTKEEMKLSEKHICKELNAREFAKLGEPRTWFDLQGAAAYLAVSEQTLSRYVKEKHGAPQREGRQRPSLSSQ
jgi:hypothetical protein